MFRRYMICRRYRRPRRYRIMIIIRIRIRIRVMIMIRIKIKIKIRSRSRRSDKPPGYTFLAIAQSSKVQKAQAAPT